MSDYIPTELIKNILARLPVDDVLRCTSVCKSWYSLITCPSFASSHLNLSSPNHEPRLLVMDNKCKKNRRTSCRYRLYRDNITFDEIAELDPPFSKQWLVIDSINGLFCMVNDVKGTVMLWNPSLRKSLILPKSSVSFNPGYRYEYKVGFGFVAMSNEYKIVKFSRHEAEIYELSTRSWRYLKLEDYPCVVISDQQVHFNGIVHWYSCNLECCNIEGNYTILSSICSFDMKNEKFGALTLPSGLCTHFSDCVPSTFRESLCLIDYGREKVCIWVMKEYGVADSWENLFTIDIDAKRYGLTSYPKFRHNGDFLFGKFYAMFPTVKSELLSYNCDKNQVKNLGVLANLPKFGPRFPYIFTYLDSLVLINQMKSRLRKNRTKISKNI